MKEYTSSFTIEANSPEDAIEKMTALSTLAMKLKTIELQNFIAAQTPKDVKLKLTALSILAEKLTANELDKLADVVENNPYKTALAKKYLGL